MLVAPAGLRVPGVEVQDFFTIPPEELAPRLVHDMNTILPFLPEDPHDVDFTVDRYRDAHDGDHHLGAAVRPGAREVARPGRHPDAHRVGRRRQAPAGRARPGWAAKLPNARVETFPNAGHLVLDESKDAREAVARFCAP